MNPTQAKLDAYGALQARLRRWLARSKHRRGQVPRLSERDVQLIVAALREAKFLPGISEVAGELNARIWEGERAYREKDAKAAARAMGWSTGSAQSKRFYRFIVADYVSLLGEGPFTWAKTLAGPNRREPPLTPVEAVKVITKRYGFQSELACIKALQSQRIKLKKGSPEADSLGGLRSDFRIPDPSQLT